LAVNIYLAHRATVKDWVLAQTIDRKRQELETEEIEYAKRLARARQREEITRRAVKGRVHKRLVGQYELLRSSNADSICGIETFQ
jgi:hypothetical protein